MAGEIDRKIELIRAAEDDLFTALKETDEQLYKELLKIYSKFVGPGGVLTLDPLELAQLEDSIISAIASTDYKGAIDTYIPNFDAIQNLNKDIHKELNDIDISEVLEENDKIQNFQNMVEGQLRGTNSIQVRVTEEGVKSLVNIPNKSLNELIDPITDIIRTDIIQGVTFEAATEGILNEIQKKRLGLERWAGQIARDSLNQADGIQNDEIRKEFDMEYVRYVGTIATNTRPVCWHFLTQKRVIKYEDLQKELNEFIPGGIPSEVKITYDPNGVERRAEKGSGMIPGTNDKNWMVRRGGYNCRHQALPAKRPPDEEVIDQLAPEAQAESVQFVPANNIGEAKRNLEKYIDPKELEWVEKVQREEDEWLAKNPTGKIRGGRKKDAVHLKGMSVEVANEWDKSLTELYSRYPEVPKLKAIQTSLSRDDFAARMSNLGSMEVRSKYAKNLAQLNQASANAQKTVKEFIDIVPKLEELEGQGKLSKSQSLLLKKGKDAAKFKRLNVADNFQDLINHEFGHHIDNNANRILKSKGKDIDKYRALLKEGIKQSNEDQYKYNISYYGFESIFVQRAEVYAESFALYNRGDLKDVPPKLIEAFNYLLK